LKYAKFICANEFKQGDLLISKDSNIGEIVILDKDYPKYAFRAIYKLPVNRKEILFISFIKHSIFCMTMDFMVPKGATIRHSKLCFGL
jgi:type I restriction enzyme S subunit